MEFILGVVAGFVLSFFSEAGKDFYSFIKNKVSPKEPPPVERDLNFCPDEIKDKEPRWVSESRTHYFEEQGCSFYKTKNNEKVTFKHRSGEIDFLMFKP